MNSSNFEEINRIEYRMDDPKQKTRTGCDRFAGRVPAGLEQPIVLKKDGVRHVSQVILGCANWLDTRLLLR